MKPKNNYVLLKKSVYKKVVSYEFNESFTVSKKKDDERIGVIKFYNERVISQVVQRSINNRFKKLLELISAVDEGDEDPSEGLVICLDEVNRFKNEMINKYNNFLKKTQIDLTSKKLEIMEKEIEKKIVAYSLLRSQENNDELVSEKSRSR